MGDVRTSLGDLTDSLSHFTSSMRGTGCYESVRVIVGLADVEEVEEEDVVAGVAAGGGVKVGGGREYGEVLGSLGIGTPRRSEGDIGGKEMGEGSEAEAEAEAKETIF